MKRGHRRHSARVVRSFTTIEPGLQSSKSSSTTAEPCQEPLEQAVPGSEASSAPKASSVVTRMLMRRGVFSEARDLLQRQHAEGEVQGARDTLRSTIIAVRQAVRHNLLKQTVIDLIQDALRTSRSKMEKACKEEDPSTCKDAKDESDENEEPPSTCSLTQLDNLLGTLDDVCCNSERCDDSTDSISNIALSIRRCMELLFDLREASSHTLEGYEALEDILVSRSTLSHSLIGQMSEHLARLGALLRAKVALREKPVVCQVSAADEPGEEVLFDAPAHCLYALGLLEKIQGRLTNAVEDDLPMMTDSTAVLETSSVRVPDGAQQESLSILRRSREGNWRSFTMPLPSAVSSADTVVAPSSTAQDFGESMPVCTDATTQVVPDVGMDVATDVATDVADVPFATCASRSRTCPEDAAHVRVEAAQMPHMYASTTAEKREEGLAEQSPFQLSATCLPMESASLEHEDAAKFGSKVEREETCFVNDSTQMPMMMFSTEISENPAAVQDSDATTASLATFEALTMNSSLLSHISASPPRQKAAEEQYPQKNSNVYGVASAANAQCSWGAAEDLPNISHVVGIAPATSTQCLRGAAEDLPNNPIVVGVASAASTECPQAAPVSSGFKMGRGLVPGRKLKPVSDNADTALASFSEGCASDPSPLTALDTSPSAAHCTRRSTLSCAHQQAGVGKDRADWHMESLSAEELVLLADIVGEVPSPTSPLSSRSSLPHRRRFEGEIPSPTSPLSSRSSFPHCRRSEGDCSTAIFSSSASGARGPSSPVSPVSPLSSRSSISLNGSPRGSACGSRRGSLGASEKIVDVWAAPSSGEPSSLSVRRGWQSRLPLPEPVPPGTLPDVLGLRRRQSAPATVIEAGIGSCPSVSERTPRTSTAAVSFPAGFVGISIR